MITKIKLVKSSHKVTIFFFPGDENLYDLPSWKLSNTQDSIVK